MLGNSSEFTVEMVSRLSDWEATIKVYAENHLYAARLAPLLMNTPDMWLVTVVRNYDCAIVFSRENGDVL